MGVEGNDVTIHSGGGPIGIGPVVGTLEFYVRTSTPLYETVVSLEGGSVRDSFRWNCARCSVLK